MAKANLPVYRIHDFDPPETRAPYFYISSLSEHIRRHTFIRKPHKHDFYVLLLVTKGTGTHTIDFNSYTVQPYTVFCLSPGQVHNWQLSEDADGYIIFFTPAYYLLSFPQTKLYSFPFFSPLLQSPFLQTTAAGQAALLNLVLGMEQEYNQQQFRKEEAIGALLHVFFIYLTRLYQTHASPARAPLNELPQLQLLENLIEQHYKEHKPVNFFAEQLHLTPKTLNEICRHIGKTTTELVKDRIILESKRLLVHSALTVSQIAAELGYFDNSYFTRFFRKYTGQTPEQFRKKYG